MFTVENISYHNFSSDLCLHDLLPNYPLSNLIGITTQDFIIVSTFVMFRCRFYYIFVLCLIFLVHIYLFYFTFQKYIFLLYNNIQLITYLLS